MAIIHEVPSGLRLSRLLVLLCLLSLTVGCTLTDTKRRDWSSYDGPGAEYFHDAEVADYNTLSDPAEPMNRGFGVFSHVFLVYLIDPLAKGYSFIVPGPVRDSISNFGTNVAYPRRLVCNLLQGKGGGAGRETGRFLINTTIGLLGLFDPATAWFDIEPSDKDFGSTFAKWGWDGSVYLVLPYFGRGSDRDTPASLFDMVLDPASYVPFLRFFFGFNEATDKLDKYKRLVRSHYDPYVFLRYIYELNRTSHFLDFEYNAEKSSEGETLKAVFLTYQDEDFPDDCDDEEVYLSATDSWLSYTYIMQDEPAPIVYILPGLGGHRESDSALGLAEMAYRNGFSAVTISSTMCFEFMEDASSAWVPGYGPIDAHDVHRALDAINDQLEEEYPDQITYRVLMGLSLGAYHTLAIAAAEQVPGTTLVEFDRYIPINPPVNLMRSVKLLDDCFHAYLDWPEGERMYRLNETIMKVLKLADGNPAPTAEIPLTEIEARFVIGLSYRLSLMFLIHCSQSRHNMGILLTDLDGVSRGPAYDEIFDYSYMEYIYAFVLKYYTVDRPELGITGEEEMFRNSDLRSMESQLRNCNKIRLFTNENDFLLSPGDTAWLKSVFPPDQRRFFPHGGHLGNLYKPEVQDEIMQSINDLKR